MRSPPLHPNPPPPPVHPAPPAQPALQDELQPGAEPPRDSASENGAARGAGAALSPSGACTYVVRLSDAAHVPVRASAGAAGYDLCAARAVCIAPHQFAAVDTDLLVVVPPRHYGRIAPRSSSALRHGVDVLAGVVDEDYRGSLRVLLVNHGAEPFAVAPGDRVAQLIFERISTPELLELPVLPPALLTTRGGAGFGSTGRAGPPLKRPAGAE